MSDNVLIDAIEEIGKEDNLLRCTKKAPKVYDDINRKIINARTKKIETNKQPQSIKEVTKEIKQDVENNQRPPLGVVSEENKGQYENEENQYMNDKNELER